MRTIIGREEDGVAHVTGATKRFGKYKDENESAIMKAKVEKDGNLEHLLGQWGKYLYLLTCRYREPEVWDLVNTTLQAIGYKGTNENAIFENIHQIAYSPSDVLKLSLVFENMQPTMIRGDTALFFMFQGEFLSKLINFGRDREYLVHSGNEMGDLNFIGFENRKKIIVEGNAGIYAGALMKGGRITIKGSAGRNLGRYMSGGIITVQGDVLGRVGRGMSGGKICIEGGFEGVSKRIKGGKVYHNGEHVYPEAGAES